MRSGTYSPVSLDYNGLSGEAPNELCRHTSDVVEIGEKNGSQTEYSIRGSSIRGNRPMHKISHLPLVNEGNRSITLPITGLSPS